MSDSLFNSPLPNVSAWKTMLSLTLRVLWFTLAIIGPSLIFLLFLSLTPLLKVSQRPGSASSHLPPQSGHTGPPFSTASRSLFLRSFSPLVRAYSLSSLSHLEFFSNWLGMIWRMNPFQMPHGFCTAQTVITGLSFHILTGICGCFTWASYLTVFKPYRSIQASAS